MDRKNMLDVVLEARIDEISAIGKAQFEKMHKETKNKLNMKSVEKFIENLPLQKSDSDKLIDMLYELEFISTSEFGYVTEKYYKAGFSDAVNIIFNAFEYEKTGKNWISPPNCKLSLRLMIIILKKEQ